MNQRIYKLLIFRLLALILLLVLLGLESYGQSGTIKFSRYPASFKESIMISVFHEGKVDYAYGNGKSFGIGNYYQDEGIRGRFYHSEFYKDLDGYVELNSKIKDKDATSGVIEIYSKSSYEANPKLAAKFKIKTEKERPLLFTSFSSDGKYFLCLTRIGSDWFYYSFDVEKKKAVYKEVKLDELKPYSGMGFWDKIAINTTDNGKTLLVSGPYDDNGFGLINMDVETRDFEFNSYGVGINPSALSIVHLPGTFKVFVRGQGYQDFIVDLANRKTEVVERDLPLLSCFVQSKDELAQKTTVRYDDQYYLSDAGISYVMTKDAAIVFDQDGNYFTIKKPCAPDITDYLRLDGQVLEEQPDLIPIITDVLEPASIVNLLKSFSDQCYSENQDLVFNIFESAEPYTEDMLDTLVLVHHSDPNIRDYFVPQYADKVNYLGPVEVEAFEDEKKSRLTDAFNFYLASHKETDDPHRPTVEAALAVMKEAALGLNTMTAEQLTAKAFKVLEQDREAKTTKEMNSLKYFEMAAQKAPLNPEYQLNICLPYQAAYKFDQAIPHVNKALALQPDYGLAHYLLVTMVWEPVRLRMKKLNPQSAQSIINSSAEALSYTADTAYFEKFYVMRAKAVAELCAKNNDLYQEYESMAQYKISGGDYAKMVENFIPKLDEVGNATLAGFLARDNAYFYKEVAEKSNNDVTTFLFADVMFDKAVKRGIVEPSLYYHWAEINIKYLKKNSEGFRIAKEAWAKFPNTEHMFDPLLGDFFFEKGKQSYEQGDMTAASDYMGRYIKFSEAPVANGYKYLGFSLYRLEQYAEAADPLKNCLEKTEKKNKLRAYYPNFDAMLAYCQNPVGVAPVFVDNTEKIEQMLKQYDAALKISNAGNHIGAVFKIEEVASYFDQINYQYGSAMAHNGAGVEYHYLKELDKARKHYQQSIDAGTSSPSSYENLSMIYLKDEDLNNAYPIVTSGIKKFPNSTKMKKAYAEYYLQLGFNEYEKEAYYAAINNFKRCFSYNREEALAPLFLGFSNYALGDQRSAKSYLRQAIGLDSSLRHQYPAIDQILNQ